MQDHDFCSGFEGEPEITFSCESSWQIFSFRMWEGYFDVIMRGIKPDANNNWTYLALYYHLYTGWYETEKWMIPDLENSIRQIEESDISDADNTIKTIHAELCKFLRQAQNLSMDVRINYS